MPNGDAGFGEKFGRWLGGTLGLDPDAERRERFRKYLERMGEMPGDPLSYEAWRASGMPEVTGITPYAARIVGEQLPEQYPEYAAWAAETPLTAAEEIRRRGEVTRAEEVEIRKAEEAGRVPSFPTEAPPEGYKWELNELNQWVPVFDPYAAREPAEMTEAERAEMEFIREREVTRVGEERRTFEAQEQQRAWEQQQAQEQRFLQEEAAERAWRTQQQQYGLQQQELEQQQQWQAWQQEEARRQYGAQLAAQPQSWLQYAAYTGEQPAIQPWMQPLMPQEYAGLGAGQVIPGWGEETMAEMPELTRPSRQYQARMGPTSMQQYLGYRQARTGVRPEEEQWRLWSGAPPGGQHQGLKYAR